MTVADGAPPAGARVRDRLWYRDPVSCLQSTVAAVLMDAGADPLSVLGLHWGFTYLPGDVRPEEYYLPCTVPGDLVGSLLPHHPVSSAWRTAPDHDPLSALTGALAAGRLPIIAVDNYHLPFRPAYRDVHAAHLVVVTDVDRSEGLAWVSDAMPPAYAGPLPLADLLRAWRSSNPEDEQDAFFTGAGTPRARWLDVRIEDPLPDLTTARLAAALAANAAGFTAPSDQTGLGAVATFGADLVAMAEAGDGDGLATGYTAGWSAQAQAALHGELLRRVGAERRLPALAEAGRLVERVAHRWTAVRVTAAHGRTDPRRHAGALVTHTRQLHSGYVTAVHALDRARRAVTGSPWPEEGSPT